MYISRVVIRNFRNFSACDIQLEHGLTCLVGVNGAGKSNFIDAIRLCIDREMSPVRWLSAEDFHRGNGPASASQVLISLEFSDVRSSPQAQALVSEWLIDNGNKARLTYRFIPRAAIREEILSRARDVNSLTIDDYQPLITGGQQGDPTGIEWSDTYGESVTEQKIQSFQVVALQALRDVTRDLKQQRNSPLQRLINATGLTADQQARILQILSEANSKIASLPELSTLAAAIQSAYEQIAGVSAQQIITIGVADPTFRAFVRSLNLLLTDAALSDYEMQRNSLGSNNLIYSGMVIEVMRRRALEIGAGELLVVEEPEAHLHPQAQYAIIGALSEEPYQTIVSTHSPVVTSRLSLDRAIVFDRAPDGESRVIRPKDTLSATELQDLNRYLDPYRGALLYAERVLLVEGLAEALLAPVLLKAIGIDLGHHHVTVIPVNGTHFDSFKALFGDGGLRKKCAVLRDGDGNRQGGRIVAVLDDGSNVANDLGTNFSREFSNQTTFEVAITQPSTVDFIADVIQAQGFDMAASRIRRAVQGGGDWKIVQLQVLRAAIRIGKARFSQDLAAVVSSAQFCPQYLEDAARWLIA